MKDNTQILIQSEDLSALVQNKLEGIDQEALQRDLEIESCKQWVEGNYTEEFKQEVSKKVVEECTTQFLADNPKKKRTILPDRDWTGSEVFHKIFDQVGDSTLVPDTPAARYTLYLAMVELGCPEMVASAWKVVTERMWIPYTYHTYWASWDGIIKQLPDTPTLSLYNTLKEMESWTQHSHSVRQGRLPTYQ